MDELPVLPIVDGALYIKEPIKATPRGYTCTQVSP